MSLFNSIHSPIFLLYSNLLNFKMSEVRPSLRLQEPIKTCINLLFFQKVGLKLLLLVCSAATLILLLSLMILAFKNCACFFRAYFLASVVCA